MTIEDLFKADEDGNIDTSKAITELKSKRFIQAPNTSKFKNELNPLDHEVFNKVKRPDKKVKIDTSDLDDEGTVKVTSGENPDAGIRYEPVARIALAIQKLIVKRAVSFIFGNPVTLDAGAEDENQKKVLKALKRVLYDIKEKSFNRKVARNLFSCTEVAELWYPVERQNNTYGFESKFKLRCAIFSPMLGDTLYPYFNEFGDMVAFSREFKVTDQSNKTYTYFETYTDKEHWQWVVGSTGYAVVEGFPKEITIGKIPVVFGHQPQVEWDDVQGLIERLEKLLSNFADTNDYHASPKIFVTGQITGFAKKGESGAIIEGDENATAQYLSWQNAPESVKLEIETLLRMIYTITQTPDISFDSIKGIGAVSGVALKLLFMDAHLKVADHQEVFDEYLQRRINIIKAYIGKIYVPLRAAADDLQVEPVIVPYIIKDEAAELKIWTDANGGNPVISQKASFEKAGLTTDTDADFEQYQKEQEASKSFNLFEPTIA